MSTPKDSSEVWDFPCTLPIKIMGPAKDTLIPLATKIIQNHVDNFSPEGIRQTNSRTGKYLSLTAQVQFQNKEQVDNLFAELAHYQQNTDDISFVI